MHLLKAIRTVARLESSPERQRVFDDIARRSRTIRFALYAHRLCRLLKCSHLLVALYGLAYFVRAGLPGHTPLWLTTGIYPNEHKQLDRIDALMGQNAPARIAWSFKQKDGWRAAFGALRHPRGVLRLLKAFKRIEARLPFMAACRVAMALFLYVRFRQWLERQTVQAVLVTSDYSPDAAALSTAAASLRIKRAYLPHALPGALMAGRTLLDYELYVFDSYAMRDRFAACSKLEGAIVYRGIHGEPYPLRCDGLMKKPLNIGIFLSAAASLNAVAETVESLARLNPALILIRGHPVQFSNPDFSAIAQAAPYVEVSSGISLAQDSKRCDLIVAGNTTAVLEVLKNGTPVVYLPTLDGTSFDYNGFVQNGLVPLISSAAELDLASVAAFYRPGWEERMQYFDAAYGQNPAALDAEVKHALLKILAK